MGPSGKGIHKIASFPVALEAGRNPRGALERMMVATPGWQSWQNVGRMPLEAFSHPEGRSWLRMGSAQQIQEAQRY